LIYLADIPSWLTSDYFFFKVNSSQPDDGMPLFAQLDARSRYQNYKLVKDNLFAYGFQKRIVKPFIKSRCQRDAVKAAAYDLGRSQQCKEYFRINGYKWYHLTPDVIFKDPSLLLTKNFWITTLFAKTYHSKIDFKKQFFISIQQETSLSMIEG
jgi:hypothetical protein